MIPKGIMMDAVKELDTVNLRAPARAGQTFTVSVNDREIGFMVTKNISRVEPQP
jgi:CxxC motif-containing protein